MSKKKLTTTNKIAATVAAVAVTSAFGAGAYAIVQDGSAFDPKGFTSAYNKGAQDERQGYRATTTSTEAQANRHKDDAANSEKSAEQSSRNDAFSNLPDSGNGTTAVSVDPKAKPGTATSANNGSSDSGSGNAGATPSGPAADNGTGDGDNGGANPTPSDPTPSTPDNPGGSTDNPSDDNGGNTGGNGDSGNTDKPGNNNGGNTGGNGSGDDNGGNTGGNGDSGNTDNGATETPQKPADVIKGEDPVIPTKPAESNPWGDSSYKVVNDKIPYTDDDVRKRGDDYAVIINSDTTVDNGRLYTGKLAGAWDVFVSMNTWYVDNDFNMVYWSCDKKDYPEYSEKYFKINYVKWDDTIVNAEDFPFVVPNCPFTVNLTYRVGPNADHHTIDVSYVPFTTLNYIVNPFVDSDVADILLTSSDSTVNLAYWNEKVIQSANDLGTYGTIVDEDGYLRQLFSGWKETSADGKSDKPVFDFFTADEGRHVYAPIGFEPINPEYKAKLDLYWGNGDGTVTPDGSGFTMFYLQALTGLEGKQFADRLTIQPGIQAIDIEQSDVFDFDVPSLLVNYLEIPSSVRYVNISSNTLAVEEGFSVSDDNPNYRATGDGILTNVAGTEYLAVPTHKKELDIPDNVTSVALSKYNNTLETITIETEDPSKLPMLDNAHLNDCKIVVKNKEVLKQAMVDYASILDSSNGNYLSVEGEGDFSIKDGIVSNNGELTETTSDDMSIVDITGITKIRKGAFVVQGDPDDPNAESRVSDVTTLVLGDGQDIEFEEGCFEGSAVKHIVCASADQKASIESRLAAIGIEADSIHVAVKEIAADGSVYFKSSEGADEHNVLLNAPADAVSFDGTLTAQDGSEVDITAIGPRAFKNCTSLKWLPLNESVEFIGSGAFSGCTALEGLFIKNEDNITVENGIFSDCDNVAFFASRAMNADFAGNEVPTYNAVMYCPTGSTGYTGGFQYFTKESNVTDFTIIPQNDGSYLLYGCSTYAGDASPTPWLCLSASTSTSGDVELPATTLEIFNRAFAEKKSPFTINWDDLPVLNSVDFQAFYNSGIQGEVSFKGDIYIGKEVFNACTGITTLVATGPSFTADEASFAGCANLVSVTIDTTGENGDMDNFGAGVFNGCDAMESLTISNPTPATLTLHDSYAFTFNFDWDNDEKHKGVINIPDDCFQSYLNAWVYPLLGYYDYESLENAAWFEAYMNNEWVEPSEQQVRDIVLEKLKPAENQLRMLLGVEKTEEVTVDLPELTHDETPNGYTFSVKEGVATLIALPESVEDGVVDFTQIIPENWTDVTIPADVFNGRTDIKKIVLSDKIDAIQNGAFEGLGDIEIILSSDNIAMLKGGSFDEPYTFGASSVKLSLPADCTDEDAQKALINDYLMAWTVNSLGCRDAADFYWEATDIASDMQKDAKDIEVCRIIDTRIMEQENVFRKMFGLDEIADLNDLKLSYAKDYCGLTYPNETEEPDEPEQPDTPINGNDTGNTGNGDVPGQNTDEEGDSATDPDGEDKETPESGGSNSDLEKENSALDGKNTPNIDGNEPSENDRDVDSTENSGQL